MIPVHALLVACVALMAVEDDVFLPKVQQVRTHFYLEWWLKAILAFDDLSLLRSLSSLFGMKNKRYKLLSLSERKQGLFSLFLLVVYQAR